MRYMYNDWKPLFLKGDEQIYFETSFERNGKIHKIITARQSEMGMTAAGVLTMKMISYFKSKYVIMVGIAAGIAHKNEVDQIYGDVVVPDIVWDYFSGKFVSASNASLNFGGISFIPRPHFVSTDGAMLEAVERAMHSKKNKCRVHIGPMACGINRCGKQRGGQQTYPLAICKYSCSGYGVLRSDVCSQTSTYPKTDGTCHQESV